MRIRCLLATLLAATCAAFTLAGPAAALPVDGRSQLLEALDLLGASSNTNLQGRFNATGELPVLFSRESSTRYSLTTPAMSHVVIDGVAYTSMSQSDRARATAAGYSSALWTYMPDDDMLSWDMTLFTGDVGALVEQGTLKQLGSTYVLSAVSRDTVQSQDDDSADAETSQTTRTTVKLDQRGRVVSIDTLTTLRTEETVTRTTSSLTVEYGTAVLQAPDESTAFPAAATSEFPRLDPLESAAYSTAEAAIAIGIAQRGYVSPDAIEAAALEQPSPLGLTATYTAAGLRYEMDGRSLCIEVRPDRQAAIVTACTP